jgi:autotransporter-associated beta strand protein
VYKADNATSLVYGSSWQGGAPPSTNGIALWDSALSGANSTALGADTAWGGLTVLEPAGPVTISGANTLTLGASGINLGRASQNLTLNLNVSLAGPQSWNAAGGRSITVSGAVSGTGTLEKEGGGLLVLAGANSMGGPLEVNGGTLALAQGWLRSAVEVGPGGALSGAGGIAGAVTVQEGATLAPGPGFGELDVSNSVTLAGTTVLEVAEAGAAPANDRLGAVTTLTYGGDLVVTNVGGPLAGGETFQLFGAKEYSGAFDEVSLPPLAQGLYWDTSRLGVDGSMTVEMVPALSAAVAGGSLQLSWPAGYTGWELQAQTNAPLSGLSSHWFNVPGVVSNTVVIPVMPGVGSAFFRLVMP